MQKIDTLLTGAAVVTMNEKFDIIMDGAVAVKDDTIVAVGTVAELTAVYTPKETVDYSGKIIMPGLVNAHTHVPMTLFRGLYDDLRLDVWLGYLMPVEREFVTPEFVKLGTRLACAEMIRSGVTSFADMYYFEEAIAEETADIGMRALLGQTILIFPAPDAPTYEDSLIRCRRFIESWNGHTLIQPAVAPHAWYTSTPEVMQACSDLARAFDVPLHTHVSESTFEVESCREQHHMPVVPWISKHGMLETKLLAAHCVHLDSSEIYDLEQAGAGACHCPSSNLKLASGIADVGAMLDAGLNLGVGTDGTASNNDLDMFEEMRLAALLAKVHSKDPTTLPARQALEMATIQGARAMHMADVTGSLEVGKRADITVVDISGVHNQPHFRYNSDSIYSQLVYASKSSDVTDVMCNGRFLMRDRELLTVDEAKAIADAGDVAARIDAFVEQCESYTYNKLVLLAGVERQESFEVQVKAPIENEEQLLAVIASDEIEITKKSHYMQYDNYMLFDNDDPDATRLRYREDEYLDDKGEVFQSRARLTLIGEEERVEFPNAVMLSQSRYLANADRTMRFYQEYFAPQQVIEIQKDRLRWRVLYKNTEFAINLDSLILPEWPDRYLEIKARTWSRKDAERKAVLMGELLTLIGIDADEYERRGYAEMV